uniref:Frizzled-3-like n=1 Tax=Sinocyclocheilus anshuiensis TaxID=1608454 RepID=A0A671QPN6_9TELE
MDLLWVLYSMLTVCMAINMEFIIIIIIINNNTVSLCSTEIRPFLCALYAPVCTEYGRVTLPCRRLCQRAKSDCYKLMDMFGVSWPDEMECSRFPVCDESYPRAIDLLPSSDGTEESPSSVQRDYGFWCPRELKIEPDLGYSFMGMRDCSPPCPNMYFRKDELIFARYFIGVVSIVCLSATLFTFLTFLIDVGRFRYPERPIIFYAVCYMMVSLVFFLGFLLEDRVSCNAASPGRFRISTVTQGSHNKACTLLFMTLYFFTMAGSVWWVILTITWFLAAVPKWGSEAIEKKALLFHVVAWGIPGALTITLMAMNKIEGDSMSGVCFVGLYDLMALRWFLLVPLALDVVVGVVLLLAGIAALNRVRMEIPLEKENQDKLVKFMIRIGVFSVLYLVPLLTVIGCYLYEQSHRSVWETTWVQERCREYHIPCPFKVEQTSRPDIALFLIKYLMMLVVGIPSVFWVGSKKTCFEWPPSASTSRAGSMRSKSSSFHGSLHRSRDGRYTACSYRGVEERLPHGSTLRLNDPLQHCGVNRLNSHSRHGSLQRLESQSRHSSMRDLTITAQAIQSSPGNGIHRVVGEDATKA